MNQPPVTVGPGRSRGQWLLLGLLASGVVLGVLFWAAGLLAEKYVRAQLGRAAALSNAVVHHEHAPVVVVDLFRRSILVTGTRLVPSTDRSNAKVQLTGTFDTLEVTGLSFMDLLFRRTVRTRTARIKVTDIQLHTFAADSLAQATTTTRSGQPWSFALGNTDLHLRSVLWVTARGDTIRTGGDGIAVSWTDLQARLGSPDAPPIHHIDQLRASTNGLIAMLSDGYQLSIAGVELDQDNGTLVIAGLHARPQSDLEAYSAKLRYEGDVIDARLGQIRISPLDLQKGLTEQIWSAGTITLDSGDVTVLRDKTLPDGPSKEMPLLGRIIRELPFAMSVDTIQVHHMNTVYRERADRSRGYAEIPFEDITATITGLRNIAPDVGRLTLKATCTAMRATQVSVVLSTQLQDERDRFVVDATIGSMPFTALNKATDPLLDVRATEGRIDQVSLHMEADDRNATGEVQLAYHGLKLSSGGKQRKQVMNRLGTLLLNTVVKTKNRKEGNLRTGKFAIDRRRDRSMFNYLWSGLREGTKAVLLPQVLTS